MAVLRALSAHHGVYRSVHILNLLGCGVRIAEAGIDADVGLDANLPAKRHELIHAQIVGLHCVPGVVPVGRALIAIADGVVPNEVRGVVAAVTPEARLDLTDQRDCVGTEPFDVISRHQRKRADVKVARAGPRNLERGVGGVGSRREGKRILLIRAGERCKGNRLAIVRAAAPNERDLHLGAGSSAQIDAARILFPVDQGEACLPDSMRSGGVKIDAGALVTDKGIVLVHDDNVIRTDGTPLANLHAHWIALRPGRRFRILRDNREVEFAIVEHFSPKTAVHGAANVLDEHAVFVLGDGHTGLAGVDGSHDLLRNRRCCLLRCG